MVADRRFVPPVTVHVGLDPPDTSPAVAALYAENEPVSVPTAKASAMKLELIEATVDEPLFGKYGAMPETIRSPTLAGDVLPGWVVVGPPVWSAPV